MERHCGATGHVSPKTRHRPTKTTRLGPRVVEKGLIGKLFYTWSVRDQHKAYSITDASMLSRLPDSV